MNLKTSTHLLKQTYFTSITGLGCFQDVLLMSMIVNNTHQVPFSSSETNLLSEAATGLPSLTPTPHYAQLHAHSSAAQMTTGVVPESCRPNKHAR